MERESSRAGADLALLVITAVWGVTFVIVQDALVLSDPYTWLALRFLAGAVAATLIARRLMASRGAVLSGAILSVFYFAGFVLQTEGLRRTTPSRSAFLTGLSVLLVPGASWVIFRRRPKPSSLVGVALATAGLCVFTGIGTEPHGATVLGDALTLGCAVVYAFHIAITEALAPRKGAMALVAWQLWFVTLFSCAAFPFVHLRVQWTYGYVSAVLFCGVFASAVAGGVQTWAQARTTAVRAALIFALEPVFATIHSVWIGRERVGAREVMGGALIILGILAAEVGPPLWARAAQRPRLKV